MDFKAGQTVKVTISKAVSRASARKTLERLFMKDQQVAEPLLARSANFIQRPKRRGGRIWTKHPTKIHLGLELGTIATLKVNAQVLKDLGSVSDLVEVASA
jgi:hypothetical protein